MMRLIVFPPAFGAPSASPFSTKAMCLLKMAGVEYDSILGDPRKSPKGKLPVLLDDDLIIADSDAIREHLEKTLPYDFDEGLSAQDRAVSRAFIRMVEEHLYFVGVSYRWMNDENWEHVKAEFFDVIPAVVRGFVTKQIRKGVKTQLYGQGMGRHSFEEQLQRADADLSAIATQIGKQKFMFGDKPTAADASVAPMLDATVGSPADTALRRRLLGDKALMDYLERARTAIFPDG